MGLKKHGILGIVAGLAFGGAVFAQDPKPTPGEMKKAEEAVSESTAKAGEAAKAAGKAVGEEATKVEDAAAKDARKAGDATVKGAKDAGKAVGKDATVAADATAKGATKAGDATVKGAKDAGMAGGTEATKVGDAAAKDARKADAGGKAMRRPRAPGTRGRPLARRLRRSETPRRPAPRMPPRRSTRKPARSTRASPRKSRSSKAKTRSPRRNRSHSRFCGRRPAQGTGRAISRPRKTVMPRPAKISTAATAVFPVNVSPRIRMASAVVITGCRNT